MFSSKISTLSQVNTFMFFFFIFLLISFGPADALFSEGKKSNPEKENFQSIITINQNSAFNICNSCEIFKTEKEDLSFPEIQKSSFSSYSEDWFKFNLAKYHYWIRFKLSNKDSFQTPNDRESSLLEVTFPTMGWIDLYIPYYAEDGTVDYRITQSGIEGKDCPDSVLSRTFVFPVEPDTPPDQWVYVRVKSSFLHQFKLLLWNSSDFEKWTANVVLFYGMVFGILLAMILYNLFLFLSLRDKTYLFYVLYETSISLFLFFVLGHSKVFFSLPPGILINLHWFFMGLFCIFAALFVRSFLNTPKNMPGMTKVLNFYIAFSILEILLGWTKFHFITNLLANIIGIFSLVIVVIVSILAVRKKLLEAPFFIIGWGVLLFGLTWWNLYSGCLLPLSFLHERIFAGATAGETLLFSFALANRIKILNKEKMSLLQSRERYRTLSNQDTLTGLYNKRFLMEELDSILQHSPPLSFSVIMLDIDFFKHFNDTWGHIEGDKVLSSMGSVLEETLREKDLACRYGGEEFVIILHNTFGENSVLIAERIRNSFSQKEFIANEKSSVCTASFGVTSNIDGDTVKSLLSRADKALYKAKEAGRNRVETE